VRGIDAIVDAVDHEVQTARLFAGHTHAERLLRMSLCSNNFASKDLGWSLQLAHASEVELLAALQFAQQWFCVPYETALLEWLADLTPQQPELVDLAQLPDHLCTLVRTVQLIYVLRRVVVAVINDTDTNDARSLRMDTWSDEQCAADAERGPASGVRRTLSLLLETRFEVGSLPCTPRKFRAEDDGESTLPFVALPGR
jgi:hypothetical protein